MAPVESETEWMATAKTANRPITVGEVTVLESRVWSRPHGKFHPAATVATASAHPLATLAKHLRKATKCSSTAVMDGIIHKELEMVRERDGRSFLYVLHYLSTGDLVYPLHEGFHRVDALLKELSFFGLVEDVLLRNATHQSSSTVSLRGSLASGGGGGGGSGSNNNNNKRRSLLLTSSSVQINRTEEDGRAQMIAKCHSVNNINEEQPADVNLSPAKARNNNNNNNRFITTVKHYLSLKAYSSASGQRAAASQRPAGVFRPANPLGSTLVLMAQPDSSINIYGLRHVLESLFSVSGEDVQHIIVPLRTTSSAYIDSQLIYRDHCQQAPTSSFEDLIMTNSKIPSIETVLWRLHRERFQPAGYVLTVRAYWKVQNSLQHQWLLHRKNSPGPVISLKPGTINKKPNQSRSGTAVTRRPSVLQRLFQPQRSSSATSTDVI